jgi:hypothetical protein
MANKTIIICDICGKDADYPDGKKSICIGQDFEESPITDIILTVDLCPDCKKNFNNAMFHFKQKILGQSRKWYDCDPQLLEAIILSIIKNTKLCNRIRSNY